MFKHQAYNHGSDTPCYSASFDCALALAEKWMFPVESDSLQEDQQIWQELNQKGSLLNDLRNGLDVFSKELVRAVDYLNGPVTLKVDLSDPGDIPAALHVLDQIAILNVFLHDSSSGLDPVIPDEINNRLQLLDLELNVEHLPLCHRLIPLNNQRVKTLERIPEQHRHNFPWYDYWSRLPDHILTDLKLHWQAINVQNNFSWLDIPEQLAKELLKEIEQDKKFYRYLENEVRLLQTVSSVVVNDARFGANLRKESLLDRVNNIIQVLQDKIPTVSIPEGATIMEGLLLTAFPRPFAFAAADSRGAECLSISVSEESVDRIEQLEIDQLERECKDGKLFFSGIIADLQETGDPFEVSCGLVVNEELIHPVSFSIDSHKFHAEFSVAVDIDGDLRIILVHQI